MTVATIDELLDGRHEQLERYGYREDKVGDRHHYVGRDQDMRAIIGPVRHRAKGLLNKGLRKKKKVVLPEPERALKVFINPEAVRKATEEINRTFEQVQESLQTVDFSKLNLRPATPPVPPQKEKKPTVRQRVRDWLTDKFYDDEWHKACRNTAADVLLWGFTVASVMVFGKGLWWVLSL